MAGWDYDFDFNVSAMTTSTNNITFYLWNSKTSSEPWTLIDQEEENVTDVWKVINFTWDPDCSNVGTNYFKINASDGSGTENTTTSTSFTVNKSTVLFTYAAGQDSTANRLGNQNTLLSFQVEDINGTVLASFPIKYQLLY